MPNVPAIAFRRHAAMTFRVASRYLRADLLHDPRKMPEIGDRVLDMEFGEDGWIQLLFENGETLALATGIHLGDPRESDTREWQEQRLQELSNEGKMPDWSQKRLARLTDRYLDRVTARVNKYLGGLRDHQKAIRVANRYLER